MEGHLEIVEQGEGLTFLGGWARIPEGAAARLRLRPEGGAPVERLLRRFIARPDLPPRDGLPAGQGFQILFPTLPAWTAARAELVIGEAVHPLTPAALGPQPFRPRGHLGAADRHGVAGWVLGLPGTPPLLLVDGRHAVPLPLDVERPDLPFDDGTDRRPYGFRLPLGALGGALRALDPAIAVMDGTPRGLVLVSGDAELGSLVLRVRRGMDGRLVHWRDGELRGWASEGDPGGDRPAVELVLDGIRWQTLPVGAGNAVRAMLPRRHPGEGGRLRVALRPAHGAGELRGALTVEDVAPMRPDRGAVLDALPRGGLAALPRVAIVVPIHDAAEDLARCLAALTRHTTGAARLILIDDASTDPAIAALLARHEGRPGIEVHRNPANLGFTATVNRGLALAGRDDVVLLNSDTEVGPGWLDGLRLAAHAGPRVASVTALSNNAGAFSAPEFETDNRLPDGWGAAELARLARQASAALWPSVPTGNGFCLYLRRDALDAVGGFDEAAFPRGYGEENDLCMRALRAGFEHLVDDRTLVWHRRSASFGATRHPHIAASRQVLADRYPDYGTLAAGFRDDPPLLAARWRLRRALSAALVTGAPPRPRLLTVLSTRSGGTPQTNRDLMAALADRWEPWVLQAEPDRLELHRFGEEAPVETHHLAAPLRPATHGSAEYDRRVADLLLRHGFELVHIRHLLWHGLGLPGVARALGIPVVFSFHDFYAVCPTIKLLDAEGRHCAGRCTEGPGACLPELWPASAMPPLRHRFVHRWREMMAASLSACDAFVTTSAHARDLLLEHFPQLAGPGIRLIPHGRDFAGFEALAAEPMPEERLRVLVPGNVSAAKGGALIAAIAALDAGREVEFHVLGAVDGALREPRPGVVLHGRYEREEFAARLREIRPHLAAVLSVWPETWCHTLTECWAAGLPVLGLRLGAVAERIGASGAGWLLDPDASAEAVLDRLRALRADRAALRARRDAVLDWQRELGRHQDAAGMAAAYDLLYRGLLDRRRSFAAAQPIPAPRVAMVLDRGGPPAAHRLPLPAGGVAAPWVVRRGFPSHPFGDAAAGPVDAAILPAGALPAAGVPAVLARAGAAGIPVAVELEEAVARALAAEAPERGALGAALAAPGIRPVATTEAAAAALEAAWLPATLLHPAPAIAAWPRGRGEAAGGPLPLLCFADDPGLAWLGEALAQLEALEVARPVLLGAGAAGLPEGLLLLPGGGPARVAAARSAGLVVLRAAEPGEAPGEAEGGVLVLPPDAPAWLAALAELSVDPARRAELTARARRAARPVPRADWAALLGAR